MSKSNLTDFISSFKGNHGKLVKSIEVFEETRASIIAKRDSYIEVAEILRDEYGFVIPIAGGAIDYPDENRMEMNYYLDNPDSDFIIIYRVHLARGVQPAAVRFELRPCEPLGTVNLHEVGEAVQLLAREITGAVQVCCSSE